MAARSGGSAARGREGHGWWPYLLPMVAFLGLIEIGRRAPESAAGAFLVARAAVPFALLVYFYARGAYPELRGLRTTVGGLALDVLVGIAGAALWMAPYLFVDSLRPEPDEAFDPAMLGPSLVGVALGLRAFGYALVTPFVEELFVRSWLARYVDVFDREVDFRDVPIARFTWRSFLAVVVYFTLSHVPWEYPVALAWVLLTQAWFYHRGHLLPLVIVHAASNLSILLFVVFADGKLMDAAGDPIPLWFFL